MISRIQIAVVGSYHLPFWFLEIKISRISRFKICKDVLEVLF